MPVNSFDIETWNELKRTEFLRRGGPHWQFDFSKEWKKIQEQKKYNEVWEKIKKKNNW